MKRFLIAACTIAVATSLVATPSMAGTRAGVPAVDGDPGVIAIPSDELSQNAEALAQRLRDKMPFISKYPKLVGNELVWEADISPMRLTYRKGVSLLDRVGASVYVSRAGVDLRKPINGDKSKATLFKKDLPTRLVTKAGPQEFRLALPSRIADELRKIPASKLASRVSVVVWNDKDITAGNTGYDRTQLTSSTLPSGLATYLAGRRTAVEPSGWRSAAPKVSLWRLMPMNKGTNTPGTIVLYNGSPFDLSVAMNTVQCVVSWGLMQNIPTGTVESGTSIELSNVAQIAGNWWYQDNLSYAQNDAKSPVDSLGDVALESLTAGSLVKRTNDSLFPEKKEGWARGFYAFTSAFVIGLVSEGVNAAIIKKVEESKQCTNAGSALTFAWTNESVGANQTTGNVNYWVPTFNRTGNMVGVPPTSLPVVAPGSPLTGYNATSQNGLAASPAVLEQELGFGGTVTLATLNTNQQNGSYNGFWCNFQNQQIGNPNSQMTTSQYGSTSLGGGTTASWGPCNATSVPKNNEYNQSAYQVANEKYLENEGFTFLIGYSTTAYNTAGPYPTTAQPTTAASAAACVATNTPCMFYLPPASAGAPAIVGCTPGTWNMLTPWNTSAPTVSLSSMPSSYNAKSELNMQLAYTGTMADGTQGLFYAPPSIGGSITGAFSPTTVNMWQLTGPNLAAVQQSLGGPGGTVNEWVCVLTASSSIPGGIPPSATAMNLGWYGVPVIASVPNPVGASLAPTG